MPRTKGSTASKQCDKCGFKNTIRRDGLTYNYLTATGEYDGLHTCYTTDGTHMEFGYKDGRTAQCCPDCGSEMVARVATKGKRKGEKFWGCQRYPNCKGIINFAGDPAALLNSINDPVELNNVAAAEPEPHVNGATNTNEPVQPINLDFNGLLSQVVTQAISNHSKEINEQLERAVGEAAQAATEAAQIVARALDGEIRELVANQTPRTVEIDVTANGVTVGHIEGTPHMQFERILKSIARRKMTWMCGPTGSGKTTAAQMAAKALGMDYTEISCGPETDQYELFGHITPDGRYIEGKIRRVFEHGGLLMLDEIDNANPAALISMNTLLSNGGAMFPDKYVERHPDFVCIAGANTWGTGADRDYVGRTELDASTISRFKFLDFDYDEIAERDWAGHDQKRWVDFCLDVRHEAFSKGIHAIISPRASINGASELRDGDDFETIANEYIWNPMDKSTREMLQSAVHWSRIVADTKSAAI